MIKKVQEEQRQYVEKKTLLPKKVKLESITYNYPNDIKYSENEVNIDGDKNKLFPTSNLGSNPPKFFTANSPTVVA